MGTGLTIPGPGSVSNSSVTAVGVTAWDNAAGLCDHDHDVIASAGEMSGMAGMGKVQVGVADEHQSLCSSVLAVQAGTEVVHSSSSKPRVWEA
jgi:hypothetical protein